MKKLLALSLLFVILSFCGCGRAGGNDDLSSAQSEAVSILDIGVISGAEVVNIRQSASLEGRILDTARRGEIFAVLDKRIEDEKGGCWVRVRYRGESAFIHDDYLYQMVWSTDTPITIGKVNDSDAYLYRAADEDSEKLYRAYQGEPLILFTTDQEDWCKAFYPNGAAFIPADQVSQETTSIEELLK